MELKEALEMSDEWTKGHIFYDGMQGWRPAIAVLSTTVRKILLPAPCVWNEDDNGTWDTACGETFVFNEGTPADNKMLFCCYCGKPLKQRTYHMMDEEFESC